MPPLPDLPIFIKRIGAFLVLVQEPLFLEAGPDFVLVRNARVDIFTRERAVLSRSFFDLRSSESAIRSRIFAA